MSKRELRALNYLRVGDTLKRVSDGQLCTIKQIIKDYDLQTREEIDEETKKKVKVSKKFEEHEEEREFVFDGFVVSYAVMNKFFKKSASGFLLY